MSGKEEMKRIQHSRLARRTHRGRAKTWYRAATYLALLMIKVLLYLLLVCEKCARYTQFTASCRSTGMRDAIREDIVSGLVKRLGVA